MGLSRHEQVYKRGMHKVENRHQIMPLTRDQEATTVMIKNIPYDCLYLLQPFSFCFGI